MEKEVKTLKIDAELHHELKKRAVEVRKTITEIAETALRQFLDGKRDVS